MRLWLNLALLLLWLSCATASLSSSTSSTSSKSASFDELRLFGNVLTFYEQKIKVLFVLQRDQPQAPILVYDEDYGLLGALEYPDLGQVCVISAQANPDASGDEVDLYMLFDIYLLSYKDDQFVFTSISMGQAMTHSLPISSEAFAFTLTAMLAFFPPETRLHLRQAFYAAEPAPISQISVSSHFLVYVLDMTYGHYFYLALFDTELSDQMQLIRVELAPIPWSEPRSSLVANSVLEDATYLTLFYTHLDSIYRVHIFLHVLLEKNRSVIHASPRRIYPFPYGPEEAGSHRRIPSIIYYPMLEAISYAEIEPDGTIRRGMVMLSFFSPSVPECAEDEELAAVEAGELGPVASVSMDQPPPYRLDNTLQSLDVSLKRLTSVLLTGLKSGHLKLRLSATYQSLYRSIVPGQ